MIFTVGLILLFFLPVIESFDRNIALNLLLISSLLISLSTPKKKFLFDFIDLLWLLMLLIFSVSTVSSWSISRSFMELLRYFAYFLIFVSVRNYQEPQKLVKRFFVPMVVANSLILSLFYILSPILKLPAPENKMSLFDPFYMGHSHLADILIFAIPISFFLKKKLLSLILSLFFLLMLVVTASRGAMISLSFAFLFYFAMGRLFNKNMKTPIKRVLLLTVITVVFLLSSFIYSNFMGNDIGTPLKGFYKPAVKENRIGYLIQAWEGFSQSLIFGTGLDTFRYVSKIYQSTPASWSWYTHNHFIQIFTETGFLGGVIFLFLVVGLIFRSIYNIHYKNHNYYNKALFIGVFASSIHSLIDYDWQYLSIFLLFFIAAGILNFQEAAVKEKNPGVLPKVLIAILAMFFLSSTFLKFDIAQLILEADTLLKENKFSQATNLLHKIYGLDSKNQSISQKIAYLEEKKGSSDSAHLWYKNAILLDPYESRDIIKKDLRLYLSQAKSALDNKNYRLAYNYLVKSAKNYPVYYESVAGEYFLFNAEKMNSAKKTYEARNLLNEYIKTLTREVNSKKLSPEEILAIVDNFNKNVH